MPGVVRCYKEHIELEHRLGNRLGEANSLGSLGAGYLFLGQYKQARALLEQARAIHAAMGARRPMAYNLGNLAEIFLDTGDLRKARQLFEQALQEFSPTQDPRGTVFILEDLGLVLLAMGDATGAARRFNEAHELALRQGLSYFACEVTAGLAACALMQAQLEEAGRYIHESWDYLKEHGIVSISRPGMVYRTCAEVFDALGETENLQAVLESAHQAFMDVADTINVPEWRQSFLENVPDNRALMEMWERRK